jgi:hypothetical protein
MALKNTASVAYFKVINVTTGKGVAGLTVAGGDFTSIKLDQDNTLGSDIKGSITLIDKGNGRYAFATSNAQMNYGVICPVIIMANADLEAYGVVIYTETAARAADKMDIVDAPNATAVTAIQNGLSKPGTAQTISSNSDITAIKGQADKLTFDLVSSVNYLKTTSYGFMGTIFAGTAALLTAAANKFFNVSTPTGTVNSLPDAVAGATNGIAIVGSVMGKSPATLAAADVTGNVPAQVKGIDTDAISAASISTGALDKLVKILGGKRIISADGTQVQIYNTSDVLVATLNRTGTGPYTWTPTWA